jgi:hypothetical protein
VADHQDDHRYIVGLDAEAVVPAAIVIDATLSRFAVAPVIALAALAVAISAAIFRFGPTVPEPARD